MVSDLTLPDRKNGSLAGHLLIATSVIQDSCFARSVIYMCSHDEAGAMGVIINYPVESVSIDDVFEQLNMKHDTHQPLPIHFGGPVEANRGFIIYNSEHMRTDNLIEKDGIAVSASVSILQQLAEGRGPKQAMLVLGYAGWSPGQLESEIESGSWISVPATPQLIFDTDNDTKWTMAISQLGFDMGHFSTVVGHA